MSTHERVTVVVVTYGERSNLAQHAVHSALAAGAEAAILVENGTSEEERRRLRTLMADDAHKVTMVEISHNVGSAGGYFAGLREVKDEWAWLLDDDSDVDPRALRSLFACIGSYGQTAGAFSFRVGNRLQERAIEGGTAHYPRAGSFMYFDIRDVLKSKSFFQRPRTLETRAVEVPYGPYGGFLVPMSAVRRSGPPRAELILYEDDTEFTSRLASDGLGLFLCPSSIVKDRDVKWSEMADARGPARLLLAPDQTRAWFAVRNRSTFDKRAAAGHRLTFVLNFTIYLAALLIGSVSMKCFRRLAFLLSAVWRGLQEDLREPKFISGLHCLHDPSVTVKVFSERDPHP